MTVKDLKELIQDVPDETPVICFPSEGQGFYLSKENSGLSQFNESCDEQGNPIDDNMVIPPLFALFDEHFEMEEKNLGES